MEDRSSSLTNPTGRLLELEDGAGRNLLCLQTISKRLCRVVSELKGRMGGGGCEV